MLEQILNLLRQDEYLGKSELIDIAKGKYQFTTSVKRKKQQAKQHKAWQ